MRKCRFSLRSAFVFMTILAALFGIDHITRGSKRAEEEIRAANGEIIYDWQTRQTSSDTQPKPSGPKWLRSLIGSHYFDRVVEVRFNRYYQSEPPPFVELVPALARLSKLRSLSLLGMDLGVEEFHMLRQLDGLEMHHICHGAAISGAAAAELSKITSLRDLKFDETIISPIATKHIAGLPNLERLTISCKYMFVGQEITTTDDHKLGDDAAIALSKCPRLNSLCLTQTLITDVGVEALSRLQRLEALTLGSPNVTGDSLEYVLGLTKLRSLGAWSWELEDKDIPRLKKLPNLKALSLLVKTPLTSESLPYLSTLTQLEFLTVHGKEITDEGLQHLHSMVNLKRLDLSDSRIAKKGEAAKQLELALPRCYIRFPLTNQEKRAEQAFSARKYGR